MNTSLIQEPYNLTPETCAINLQIADANHEVPTNSIYENTVNTDTRSLNSNSPSQNHREKVVGAVLFEFLQDKLKSLLSRIYSKFKRNSNENLCNLSYLNQEATRIAILKQREYVIYVFIPFCTIQLFNNIIYAIFHEEIYSKYNYYYTGSVFTNILSLLMILYFCGHLFRGIRIDMAMVVIFVLLSGINLSCTGIIFGCIMEKKYKADRIL